MVFSPLTIAGVAIAVLAAALGVTGWLLKGALEDKGAAEARVEERDRLIADRDRKIAAQNAEVDRLAQAGELAKAQRDEAIAKAADEIRFHRSRADALRPLVRPATPRAAGTPETPAGRGLVAPAPAQERTAAAALAEIRKRLRP